MTALVFLVVSVLVLCGLALVFFGRHIYKFFIGLTGAVPGAMAGFGVGFMFEGMVTGLIGGVLGIILGFVLAIALMQLFIFCLGAIVGFGFAASMWTIEIGILGGFLCGILAVVLFALLVPIVTSFVGSFLVVGSTGVATWLLGLENGGAGLNALMDTLQFALIGIVVIPLLTIVGTVVQYGGMASNKSEVSG